MRLIGLAATMFLLGAIANLVVTLLSWPIDIEQVVISLLVMGICSFVLTQTGKELIAMIQGK